MQKTYRTGAKAALLDEYEKAIAELQLVISGIPAQTLTMLVDHTTKDINCASIQSVLTHVVDAGYSYAMYVQQLKGMAAVKPAIQLHNSVEQYQADLHNMFAFTVRGFTGIHDNELEAFDNTQKIMTSWGQVYDIEQMMEHAIVHILRHRRQIEKFKLLAGRG